MTDNSHQFLATLDDLQAFRVTQVASFAECPRRWKANLLGEGEQKESPYARMGTAVHLVVEHYLAGRYSLPDGWDEQRGRLAAAGVCEGEIEHTRRYVAALSAYRDRKVALEFEFTRSIVSHVPPIRGHIDAIFRGDAGSLIVRDHKTNRTPHDADWWRAQVQPRLYAWAVRQLFGEEVQVDFEIGYVNLGTIVTWRTERAEDRAVIRQYLDVWHAYRTYRRTNDWPEFINEWCSYCPLRKTCGRLLRAQNEFLGALKKKEDAGWSTAERYRWALDVMSSMQTRVNDLKAELLAECGEKGPQQAGDTLFVPTLRSHREVNAYEMPLMALSPEEFNRLYRVSIGALDDLLKDRPEMAPRVQPLIRTISAEEPTLVRKKVADGPQARRPADSGEPPCEY